MPYDETLAQRVRDRLSGRPRYGEIKMFGGLCFTLGGHMACGVLDDRLMVRVGVGGHEAALAEPDARPMDFTGRPLRGMVYVDAEHLVDEARLQHWVDRGAAHAAAQPPKAPKPSKAKKPRS